MQTSPSTPQSSATISAMSLLGITEELQLTHRDIALHDQGPEWKSALTARIDWKEKEIEEITCRQKGKIKHQERIRDQKRIETEFKVRKNFRIEYTSAQTNILYHPAVNDRLWVSNHVRKATAQATTWSGRKFLSHQFTFLEPPIFLNLKMNLPATSLKPAFL